MNFDILDKQMRGYEKSLDRCCSKECFLVARLDGHGFTRMTNKEWNLEKPFDERFHNLMKETLVHLMDCGFRIIYGYTQSDEISLLFHKEDMAFGRKERKLLSILAAEASVAFSTRTWMSGIFDCRLIPLPNEETVADYFRWRMEDSHRNSLNSHCYWMLRKQGKKASEAQRTIASLSNEKKYDLLLANGIDYDKLPCWQKHGIGIYHKTTCKEGYNPILKNTCKCERKILFIVNELTTGNNYSEFILNFLKT